MREDDEDAAKAVNGSKGRKSLTTDDDDDGGMWNYFFKSLTFCFAGKTCWIC